MISLGNSFAVEETIAPSRTLGCSMPVGCPDNFPTGCFAAKQDRVEIILLEVGREGKERRILLRTPFFNPHSSTTQKTVSVKGMESCFAIFQSLRYWRIPAVTSKMKLLFCSCLENVASWDFWAIFCFGPVPFDPASMDKNSLLRQLWGWRWLDLVFFPRPSRSAYRDPYGDEEEWA